MISHEHKCIFIHIPRTAGTLIEKLICGNDYWYIKKQEKHLWANEAKKIYADYWDDYFKFTIIRNPYDRMYSLVKKFPGFANQKLNGNILEDIDGYLERFTFDNKPVEIDHRFHNRTKIFNGNFSKHSMYQNIIGNDMDLILDYDSLSATLPVLSNAIGVDIDPSIIRKKTNSYMDLISDKAKKQIYSIHKNDIDRFKFDNAKHHSQLGQEKWVLAKTLYKTGGFFVEAGACDGKNLSNTFALEKDYGWNGICCEPNPEYHTELSENRTCQISHDCLYSVSGKFVEFAPANELGGIVSEFKTDGGDIRANKRNVHEKILVKNISLLDLLEKYNAPKNIDYISLDTEGSEISILSTFDFNKYNVKLWTVEHNNISLGPLINLFQKNGYDYTKIKFDAWFFKK